MTSICIPLYCLTCNDDEQGLERLVALLTQQRDGLAVQNGQLTTENAEQANLLAVRRHLAHYFEIIERNVPSPCCETFMLIAVMWQPNRARVLAPPNAAHQVDCYSSRYIRVVVPGSMPTIRPRAEPYCVFCGYVSCVIVQFKL